MQTGGENDHSKTGTDGGYCGQIGRQYRVGVQGGLPFLLLDFYDDAIAADCVLSDNVSGEYQPTEQLLKTGRRKLAYEIAGKTEGNYVVVKYTAEPATSDELDRVLNLNESVIRTKILRKG